MLRGWAGEGAPLCSWAPPPGPGPQTQLQGPPPCVPAPHQLETGPWDALLGLLWGGSQSAPSTASHLMGPVPRRLPGAECEGLPEARARRLATCSAVQAGVWSPGAR